MIRGIVIGVLAGIGITTSLPAQQAVAIGRHGPDHSPLMRKVSAEFTNVTVRAAIDQLAERSGVRIQYRASVVEGVQSRVTMSVKEIPLGIALERVFHGTRLRVTPVGSDFLTVVASTEAQAAVQGKIIGKVIHAKTRQPLSGATIRVGDAGQETVTTSDGQFQLDLPAGSHTFYVRHIGFVRQSHTVQVEDGESISVEIVLEPSASVLDEVVVTGTVVATERKAIVTPITVITAEDIEKRGITRIEEFFRGEVPGVIAFEMGTAQYAGGNVSSNLLGGMQRSQVYSRGSSSISSNQVAPNPLKTFIDGVELLDPSYLGTIDPQMIERIEIVTGPQAATIYGSGAMGGVMQIFTKKGSTSQQPELVLQSRYGMLQSSFSNGNTPAHRHSLSIAGNSGTQFSYSSTLAYLYTGQWQPHLYNSTWNGSVGGVLVQDRITTSGAVAIGGARNGTTAGGASGHCAVGSGCPSSLLDQKFLQNGEWLPSRFTVNDVQRVSASKSQNLSLNIDIRATNNWSHHLTAGKNQTSFELDPERPRFRTPEDTLFVGAVSSGERVTLGYNTAVTPNVAGILSPSLTVGVTGSFGDETRSDGCTKTPSATIFIGCSSSYIPSVRVSRTIDTKNFGGFANARVGIYDNVYFTFGIRGEQNPRYGENHRIDWTPTMGVASTLTVDELTIKALMSYGKATRSPGVDQRRLSVGNYPFLVPSQFVSTFANPDLTPEYSQGPQGGIELYFSDWATVTVNTYRQTITNLIQSVRVDSIAVLNLNTGENRYWPQYQYQNVARIKQKGWEVTGSASIAMLLVKGTYSWNDSRVLSTSSGISSTLYPGMSFMGLPSHTANFNVSYARGGSNVSIITNYIGSSSQWSMYAIPDAYMWSRARIQSYVPARFSGSSWPMHRAGYTKTDMNLSHQVTGKLSVVANITNVGNSFESDATLLSPSLGRQTFVGLVVRY